TTFSLYATPETHSGLVERNAMFRTLRRQSPHAVFRPIAPETPHLEPLYDGDGEPTGLRAACFTVRGKVPLHLEGVCELTSATNVGLIVEDAATGARLVYAPGAGGIDGLAE